MTDPYQGQSADPNVPGIIGENTAGGDGVSGKGRRGVVGESDEFQGVYGKSIKNAGVVGESAQFHAVFGISHDLHNGGVFGANDAGGFGVIGTCDSNIGVAGDSKTGSGVRGTSQSGRGVEGSSKTWQGVYGSSDSQAGVVGESNSFDGVYGISHNAAHAGVSGHNPGGLAGFFDGNVVVTGDVTLTGADFAEEFDVSEATDVGPGTVMVLDQEGALQPSQQAYDKRVAGVISGAGDCKPGLILDKKKSSKERIPVALVGKVYCKVDAEYAPIEVGDLLTTSPTAGHAMKADDHLKAFGAVIGKALRPLREGQELIPILIALQ